MKTLFTAEAASKGGRSGTIHTPDGLLNVELGNPLEAGLETRGPSPELLFAGAYAACFHGAIHNAARRAGAVIQDSEVRALVSLTEDAEGGFHLSVALHARLSGVDSALAHRVMEMAHQTCPYSRALRGDAPVTLTLDPIAPHLPPYERSDLQTR